MRGRPEVQIRPFEYKRLNQRIYKLSGFDKKLNFLINRIEELEIKTKLLSNSVKTINNKLHRR